MVDSETETESLHNHMDIHGKLKNKIKFNHSKRHKSATQKVKILQHWFSIVNFLLLLNN